MKAGVGVESSERVSKFVGKPSFTFTTKVGDAALALFGAINARSTFDQPSPTISTIYMLMFEYRHVSRPLEVSTPRSVLDCRDPWCSGTESRQNMVRVNRSCKEWFSASCWIHVVVQRRLSICKRSGNEITAGATGFHHRSTFLFLA